MTDTCNWEGDRIAYIPHGSKARDLTEQNEAFLISNFTTTHVVSYAVLS